jgi:hypothetical protein
MRKMFRMGYEPCKGFNLGIHTGPVEGTEINLIAWDLDNEAALEWAQSGGIPETPLITCSSRGQHWYYLRPKEITETIHTRLHKIKPEPHLDIDVIADGNGDRHRRYAGGLYPENRAELFGSRVARTTPKTRA